VANCTPMSHPVCSGSGLQMVEVEYELRRITPEDRRSTNANFSAPLNEEIRKNSRRLPRSSPNGRLTKGRQRLPWHAVFVAAAYCGPRGKVLRAAINTVGHSYPVLGSDSLALKANTSYGERAG
jgi:hypothetical protein